jgi:hypothetical protein
MSHTALASNLVEMGGGDAFEQCGNEFGSLRELIMWMIRHHKVPNPPDPEPWLKYLTTIAEGLQKVVIATDFKDAKLRSSIALEGVRSVQAGLKGIENGLQR